MENHTWDQTFRALFDRCVATYQGGNSDFNTYFGVDDLAFLGAIGYKPREFYDFVEDHVDYGDPSAETAVLIAAARRDYLLTVMEGEPSDHEVSPADLPAKDSEMGGIRWLPRILRKAQAKLRGELHPDMMFCCGGDRAFLREHDIHPADFLRVVWSADSGKDADMVLAYVRKE